MAKTSIRIEIPFNKSDELITLATKIEKRNAELGDKSPISSLNMTSFSAALKLAKEKKEEARRLHEEAEKLNQEANLALGLDRTQNSKTADTVLNIVTSTRDILVGLNRGKEENLNAWGFKVANGTASKTSSAAKV